MKHQEYIEKWYFFLNSATKWVLTDLGGWHLCAVMVLNCFCRTRVFSSVHLFNNQNFNTKIEKAAHMDEQLQLSTATAFLFKTFSFGHLWFTNNVKTPNGLQEYYLQNQNSGYGDNGDFWVKLSKLFASIHSLYVVKIVVLQLFPLQLERIRNKTCLGRPRLWTQMHLHRNLKSLKFNCVDEKKKRTVKLTYICH